MKRIAAKMLVSLCLMAMVIPLAGSRCDDRYFPSGYGFDVFGSTFDGFGGFGSGGYYEDSYYESYDYYDSGYYDGGYYDDGYYDDGYYDDGYYDGYWKGKK